MYMASLGGFVLYARSLSQAHSIKDEENRRIESRTAMRLYHNECCFLVFSVCFGCCHTHSNVYAQVVIGISL